MPDKFSALAGLVLRPILRSCPTSRRFCVCGGGGGGGREIMLFFIRFFITREKYKIR